MSIRSGSSPRVLLATLSLLCLVAPVPVFGQSVGKRVTTSPDVANIGGIPADCALAVGGTHVVVVDNVQIVAFEKEDFGPSSQPAAGPFDLRGANGFWVGLQPTGERAPFDPRVVYDLHDDCFWVVAMEAYPASLANPVSDMFFDIAVIQSDMATINKFRFDIRPWTDPDLGDLDRVDFPSIAVDADHLYISAWTQSGTSPGLVRSPVWIIEKEALLANGTTFVQSFRDFDSTDSQKLYNHRATPQPVLNLNPNGEPQYFLGVDPGNGGSPPEFYPNNQESNVPAELLKVFDEITIHAVQVLNPTEIQRDDFTLDLTVSPGSDALKYRIPKDTTLFQPSPGNVDALRLVSARFWSQPVFRDDYLWAAHHVRLEADDSVETRWYRIKMNGWPDPEQGEPELEAAGEIQPSSGSAIFPSVSVNFWWDMLVSYTHVGPTQFGEPEGFLKPWSVTGSTAAIPVDCSNCELGAFTEDLNSNSIRWGDYSGTAADPADWCVYWTYTMWVEEDDGGDKWTTWLARNQMSELCEQEFGPDYSRNGTVGPEDAAIFDTLFDESSPHADYNRDRTVDALDYVAFLQGYSRAYR